jgi:hypothetical protein
MRSSPRTLPLFVTLLAASASKAGPYWLWQDQQYHMFAGDLLFSSVDATVGSATPVTRSIHKVVILKSGILLEDDRAMCFVHFHGDEPVLMYCEPGHKDTLSGGVWRRSRGTSDFVCISGCGSKVPKRFHAALD